MHPWVIGLLMHSWFLPKHPWVIGLLKQDIQRTQDIGHRALDMKHPWAIGLLMHKC